MRFYYILVIFVLIFTACKKSEIEQFPLVDSSSDTTINNVTYKNYVERTYRLALGREPDSVEYANGMSLLTNSNLDSASRCTFIDSVLKNPDFRIHNYEEVRIKFLDNADTVEFSNWIYIFQIFLQDTNYQHQWAYYQYEYDRLIYARDAFSAYLSARIEIEELQRRMCDNYIYDQKHIGTANFVLSTFSNLINRNPTASEQQAAISMVNNNDAVLFQEEGSSKSDYLNIFIQSNDYYEGQINLVYLKYLNRAPGTLELSEGTQKYFSTKDYTSVQKDILVSNEFIGIK